ncbi:MAG: hypothetical protein J0I07_07700 [Myxococcales bacterium]|nr:hypothetical protein [Myxococcales bacterium]
MRFTSHTLLDGGVLEREFTLAGFTGILWMPPTATPSSAAPSSGIRPHLQEELYRLLLLRGSSPSRLLTSARRKMA